MNQALMRIHHIKHPISKLQLTSITSPELTIPDAALQRILLCDLNDVSAVVDGNDLPFWRGGSETEGDCARSAPDVQDARGEREVWEEEGGAFAGGAVAVGAEDGGVVALAVGVAG